MKTSASISARLWHQAQPKAFQCLYHPFVASLAAGTLTRDDFQAFLLQDAYFLNAFAKAFAYAVTKTSASEHTLAIVRLMGSIESELRTHSAFLESFGIDLFHVQASSAAPATLNYVNFLLATAKRHESVAEILTAMTPCMRLYAFIGQRIAEATKHVDAEQRANPYQRWIDSYAIPEFDTAAYVSETLLDDIAAHEGVSYETLLPLYNMAMELELRFFEEYFPMARAATHFPPSSLTFPLAIDVAIDEQDTVPSCEDLDKVLALAAGRFRVILNFDSTEGYSVELKLAEACEQNAVPLLATLLFPTQASAASTQSKAELVAFLKAFGARGCFASYSSPASTFSRHVPRVLTIAGSDSGGGAGIQADMKACTNLGVFSSSAITAVTVQNTQGVHGIHAIPTNEIADQIMCVLDDIGTDVIKTGMLFNEETIEMVATLLQHRSLPLVVDPVMVATSGHRLLEKAAHTALVDKLFPLATIITPNIPETSVLLDDRVIESIDDMKQAARDLAAFGPAFVLVKGGHLKNPPHGLVHDVLLDVKQDEFHVIQNPKLSTRNTHGTGCTLAAAIAAQFAKSRDMVAAVKSAIAYLHAVLDESQALRLGKGYSGPMLHVA